MSLDPTEIFIVLIASVVGFSYYKYGRRQEHMPTIICGVALMGYPYLVHGVIWLLVVGSVLAAGPFVYRA